MYKIIALCKKNNINIVYITTPTDKSYYENLNKIQIEKTIKTITDLVKNNSNCYYLNLLNSEKFTKEDFYDADHLNEIGAKKLSLLLNAEINSQ